MNRRTGARSWLIVGVAVVATMLQAGCAPVSKQQADEASNRSPVWPSPPDRPRFAYETRLRSAGDIQVPSAEESLRQRLTGGPPPQKPAFEKIGAIGARLGRIYATDTMRKQIIAFDVPRRRVFAFGLREPGRLDKPVAMAVDNSQNVYVVDAARGHVIVYDGLGLYQRTIGEPKELTRPTGIAVSGDGERIYVVDRATNESDNHRVVVYDKEGRKLKEIGHRGSGPGEFNVPVQAAVGSDGKLYVLDAGNFRVQVFDADGKHLRSFGTNGDSIGSFARPRGIAVDAASRVYVSDAFFGNFQVFDSEGEVLLAVGHQSTTDGPGRYGLISALAIDETGRIYVADQLFNKIEVIKPLAATDRKAD
jgi:DNA-binding beta-propeller fold protein YncE